MAQQRNHASKSPDTAGRAKAARAPRELSGAAQPLLGFRNAIGNQAFSRLLQSGRIRGKLAVGAQNNPLEKEADGVADIVDQTAASIDLTRTPASTVRQKSQSGAGQSAASSVAPAADGLENILRSASQGGQPLAPGVRAFMEARMGADLSEVRIHTGPLSSQLNQELNSVAFTHDSHIHFGDGKYDPLSPSGRRLLAHELAHVVQQGSNANGRLIQRSGGDEIAYTFLVPDSVQTREEMFRLFNNYVFGRDNGLTWFVLSTGAAVDVASVRGKQVRLHVPRSMVERATDPSVKREREESKKAYQGLKRAQQADVNAEANKRYYQRSGDKPGTRIEKVEIVGGPDRE